MHSPICQANHCPDARHADASRCTLAVLHTAAAPVHQVALRLIETFVEKSDDHSALIAEQFVPAMMDPILGDYARNVPDARWGAGHFASAWDYSLCRFCCDWWRANAFQCRSGHPTQMCWSLQSTAM